MKRSWMTFAAAVFTAMAFAFPILHADGAAAPLIQAGNPFQPTALNELAVYLRPDFRGNPETTLSGLLKDEHGYWTKASALPRPDEVKTPQIYVHVINDVPKTYRPPDLHGLQYFGRGLTPDQGKLLQKCQQACVIDFVFPSTEKWRALRSATYLVGELARSTNGWVWDEDTREIFTADAWAERRLANWAIGTVPNISRQIVIHEYKDPELPRAITLGMAKFGLPDIVLSQYAQSNDVQTENLIDLLAQAWSEGQQLKEPGKFELDIKSIQNQEMRERVMKSLREHAEAHAEIELREGTAEKGDPSNRLVEIVFNNGPGDSIQTRQDALFSSIFGSTDDVKTIRHDDALLAESASEQQKLASLQPLFAKGLPPGEYLDVKCPFFAPNGDREWMWVEITEWKGDAISGILQNDPIEVKNLRAGSRVTVSQKEVFDFIHAYADGHQEGNTTGPMIEKMESAK